MIRKIFYIGFVGALSCSATAACIWQSSRYNQSIQQWAKIRQELNKDKPQALNDQKTELFPMRYVELSGKLLPDSVSVLRPNAGRMGYLQVRIAEFNQQNTKRHIIVNNGWFPEMMQTPLAVDGETVTIRGILRKREKKDYAQINLPQSSFKQMTYIDPEQCLKKWGLASESTISDYFMERLQTEDDISQKSYPYRTTRDKFQLPYLTPDKHLGYAIFWGLTANIGFFSVIKVFRMKF